MNQNVKGKATPRHMLVMMSFHKAQASQQNKGIDLDSKPQKLSGKNSTSFLRIGVVLWSFHGNYANPSMIVML